MKKLIALLFVFVSMGFMVYLSMPQKESDKEPVAIRKNKGNDLVPNSYIVNFKLESFDTDSSLSGQEQRSVETVANVLLEEVIDNQAKLAAEGKESPQSSNVKMKIKHIYDAGSVKGFSADLTPEAVKLLESKEIVKKVYQDFYGHLN